MQAWTWLKLNPRGDVDLDVSLDPTVEDWVHIPPTTIRTLRRFGTWLEDADQEVTDFEAKLRSDVGFTDEVAELLKILQAPIEDQTPEALLKAPDIIGIQQQHQSGLNRYIQGEANPYPKLYAAVLAELGGRTIEPEDLPMWALGMEGITLIVQHWQLVPFALSTPPAAPTSPMPRRGPQDRKPKST